MAVAETNKIITHGDGQSIATSIQNIADAINDQEKNVHLSDAQTITGLKTFSTLPQSSTTPSDDKDLATKKYSDDLWATRKAQEEKCYQALKTVTKDFTRTDPVYVRIGEDGEPEIHYTITQADGTSYFESMNLGKATIYIHNGKILNNVQRMFMNVRVRRVNIDSIGSSTELYLFNNTSWTNKDDTIVDLNAFDTSKVTSFAQSFYYNQSMTEFPAFDLSAVTNMANAFLQMVKLLKFRATGMKVSFDLSSTALKHDAILEVFNNLGSDVAEGTTLTLGSEKLALMSDEEKKIATDKGWTLA